LLAIATGGLPDLCDECLKQSFNPHGNSRPSRTSAELHVIRYAH